MLFQTKQISELDIFSNGSKVTPDHKRGLLRNHKMASRIYIFHIIETKSTWGCPSIPTKLLHPQKLGNKAYNRNNPLVDRQG